MINNVQPEEDVYFYHPDHLDPSSWITYTDGSAVQHLHYLPWGEDFVNQRTTDFSARYTFSAKEKDSETGLSYFGSRYYSSDLSVWLSVDPMAAKYPSLSPYVYCANNPVKVVDPNGEEIYEFDENGKYLRVSGEKGSPDQIVIKNTDGTTIAMSKEYNHGTIQLGLKGNVNKKDKSSVFVQSLQITGDDIALECFKFVADNTTVEWALIRVGNVTGKNGINFLASSQEYDHNSTLKLLNGTTYTVREHWHSHPDGKTTVSDADADFSDKLRYEFGNPFDINGFIPTYIYSKGRQKQYNSFMKMLEDDFKKAWEDWQKEVQW